MCVHNTVGAIRRGNYRKGLGKFARECSPAHMQKTRFASAAKRSFRTTAIILMAAL